MENKNNQIIKFVKLKNIQNLYQITEWNSSTLYDLASFLTGVSATGPFYDMYADWLKGESSATGVGGNAYNLVEVNGKVHVCDQFPVEGIESTPFVTTKKCLLSIINRWIDIALTTWIDEKGKEIPLPAEVIIIQDGDSVKITRSDGFDPAKYIRS